MEIKVQKVQLEDPWGLLPQSEATEIHLNSTHLVAITNVSIVGMLI